MSQSVCLSVCHTVVAYIYVETVNLITSPLTGEVLFMVDIGFYLAKAGGVTRSLRSIIRSFVRLFSL